MDLWWSLYVLCIYHIAGRSLYVPCIYRMAGGSLYVPCIYHMAGGSHCRWLRSLLLCLCDVFRELISLPAEWVTPPADTMLLNVTQAKPRQYLSACPALLTYVLYYLPTYFAWLLQHSAKTYRLTPFFPACNIQAGTQLNHLFQSALT